jgi:hypothetical protein
MPDFTFNTADEIPEELRGEAKKNDAGKFVLNLVHKIKLDEFRENNVKVSKERDDLLKKFGLVSTIVGEDPEAFQKEVDELRKMNQQVKDGKLKASDDIEKVLTDRTSTMRKTFEEQAQINAKELAKAKDEIASLTGELKKINIDRSITAAVLDEKSGALHEALPHILSEAYKVFIVENSGDIVPKNGDAIIYGADGATAMTPTEWLHKLREKHSYLFKNSAGGGASGNKDPRFGGLSQEAWNKLSPEAKLRIANGSKY